MNKIGNHIRDNNFVNPFVNISIIFILLLFFR